MSFFRGYLHNMVFTVTSQLATRSKACGIWVRSLRSKDEEEKKKKKNTKALIRLLVKC